MATRELTSKELLLVSGGDDGGDGGDDSAGGSDGGYGNESVGVSSEPGMDAAQSESLADALGELGSLAGVAAISANGYGFDPAGGYIAKDVGIMDDPKSYEGGYLPDPGINAGTSGKGSFGTDRE